MLTPGILITGGSEHPTAVELYLPNSGDVCLMPQISGIRDVSKDTDLYVMAHIIL